MKASNDKNFKSTNFHQNHIKREILEALPINIRDIFIRLPSFLIEDIEEIRLRVNKPLMISAANKDYFVGKNGEVAQSISQSYIVTKMDIEKAYQLITDYSIYALEEEIRNGFVTLKGGHRVGICGTTVLNNHKIKTIKNISGLNIRISKQKIGISDKIMPYLINDYKFYNTLIVSPPQCGKTTLLRDIIRNLGNGMKFPKFTGFKVGVVDERSEICAMYQGIPQNDVGIKTDILDACPKAEGIIMMIRSMSPQIIATDEIGKKEDVDAIEEALNAGIKLITTVHGMNLEEITRRANLNNLLLQGIFDRIIILSNQPRVGTIRMIIDGKDNKVIATYPTNDRRNNFVC
ncbi:stage III sporulation protein AA [Crassaminicella thermophila]|uniref:Stage III sporulation protein AA n=1 Tax=Crassaminicella thermophila TaxID=2599308 RepID=A0A5C0SDI3_CRATE|nr:stage III sporulation protein AA [Crassaminicella thermophila]QEK12140.1 stage III sporulation protein AA [Crassaminicella thermophila]